LPATKASAPSAQTEAMISHDLPRLLQSASAAAFALAISSRSVIAQLDGECANTPHSVPKKLISTGHFLAAHAGTAPAAMSASPIARILQHYAPNAHHLKAKSHAA